MQTEEMEDLKLTNTKEPEISLAVIVVTPISNTMRILEKLGDNGVVVLVDFESTHNFLDPFIVQKIKLSINDQRSMLVKMANGKIISSSGCYDMLKVKFLGHQFEAAFYMLPLGGCNMVVGVRCLETLWLTVWDFSKITMQFEVGQNMVML